MALKLRNRRLYPLVFLASSAIVIASWFRLAPRRPPELLVAAVGGVAGFVYFLYRQHLDETKLFKDLYTEFNRRYDALNDDLNKILFGPREGSLSDEERERLFGYFNLCAEEYFFYEAGYIDHLVWESWSRGMKDFFKHPRIRALWELDCKTDSYYGFRPPE